jgi:hypothetical protein
MAQAWNNFGVSTLASTAGVHENVAVNPFLHEYDGSSNAYYGYNAVAVITKESSSTYWDVRLFTYDYSLGNTASKLINYTSSKYCYNPSTLWVSPHEVLIIYSRRDDGTFCRIYDIDADTVSSEYTIETVGTNSWSYPLGAMGLYQDEFGIVHVAIGTRNSSGNGCTVVGMHYPEDGWDTWSSTTVKTGDLAFANAATLVRRRGYLYLGTAVMGSGNVVTFEVWRKAINSDPGTTWTNIYTSSELPYDEVSNKYKIYHVTGTLLTDGSIVWCCDKWFSSSESINYRPLLGKMEFDDDTYDSMGTWAYIEDTPSGDYWGTWKTHVVADQTGGAFIIGYAPGTWGPDDGYSRIRVFHNINGEDWDVISGTTYGPVEDAGGTLIPNQMPYFNSEFGLDGNIQSNWVMGEMDAIDGDGLDDAPWLSFVSNNNKSGDRPLMYLSDTVNSPKPEWAHPGLVGAKQQCVSWTSAGTLNLDLYELDTDDCIVNFVDVDGDTNIYRALDAAWIRVVVFPRLGGESQAGYPYIKIGGAVGDTGWINQNETINVPTTSYVEKDINYVVRVYIADSVMVPKLQPSDGGVAYVESTEVCLAPK